MPWHNLHPFAWEHPPRRPSLPASVRFRRARDNRNRYLFRSETWRRAWRERQQQAA